MRELIAQLTPLPKSARQADNAVPRSAALAPGARHLRLVR
jgi:hypothetical protein